MSTLLITEYNPLVTPLVQKRRTPESGMSNTRNDRAGANEVTPQHPRRLDRMPALADTSRHDSTEGLPPLRADEQRKYDKLSLEAKEAITSQQPAGFRESTRSFAIKMLATCGHVNDRVLRESAFDENTDSETPFTPNNVRMSAKLTPPDGLKDNEEAKKIISEFDTILQTTKVELTKKSHEMAKLATKMAKQDRLEAFASGLLSLIEEQVSSSIQDTPRTTPLDVALPTRYIAAASTVKLMHSWIKEPLEKYLEAPIDKIITTVLNEITTDESRQDEIKYYSGVADLQPADTLISTIQQPTDDEKKLIQQIAPSIHHSQLLDKITWESQKLIDSKFSDKLTTSRIIARRRAKQKESATAATVIALSGEPVADMATLNALIHKMQKGIEGARKAAETRARKKSSGGRRPTAKPNKKQSGQSRNDASEKPSRRPGLKKSNLKQNGNGKKTKAKQVRFQPQGKGNGRSQQKRQKRKKNPGGNNNAARSAKRQKRT